jgi:uncharacterized membrane protein YraQ (UPF0718 family)
MSLIVRLRSLGEHPRTASRGAVSTAEPSAWSRIASLPVGERVVGAAFGALALAAVVVHALRIDEQPAVETFLLVLISIVVEALPFILVGALVSAALGVFVSDGAFARVARLPAAAQLPCAAIGSLAFPVCDCGTVPVARRLLARGIHPSAALTFMFAAPIVNPIVIASTILAYGGGRHGTEVAAARTGLGLVVAVSVALVVGRAAALRPSGGDKHNHESRAEAFASHLTWDFLSMGRLIVVGAALAALLQTVVPQSSLAAVASTPVLAELTLMAVAFALSLCSEADAFVAASLGAFGLGPQLAFLVIGPIADAKLTILYSGTFRRLFAARVLLVAVPLVLVGSIFAARVVG